MKKLLPLLLLLLLPAGCAQNDKTEETPTDGTEPQTALETVADVGEQEIRLLLDDEGMTVSAKVQDSGMQADFPPETTRTAAVGQTAAASAPTTAKADKETQNTITTTATKPAASQSITTTTKPAASQKNTTTTTVAGGTPTTVSAPTSAANGTTKTTSASTSAANGTTTSTSAATLPTADAEKGRYELPAIPLG